MPGLPTIIRRAIGLLALLACAPAAPAQAPYVGASEADNEFHRVTLDDLAVIRQKKVLLGTRSFGLNLLNGLRSLKVDDQPVGLNVGRAVRNFIRDDPAQFPADVFDKHTVVHYHCSLNPTAKRIAEIDGFLRKDPWQFARVAEVVKLEFSTVHPNVFKPYADTFDALRKDYPRIHFIIATGGLHPLPKEREEQSWAFSDLVLEHYRDKAPIYDWRSLLSTRADGTSVGKIMVPEFNGRPAATPDLVHPNTPYIQERLAKAWIVLMWKLYCNPGLIANAGFDRTWPIAPDARTAEVTLDASASTHLDRPAQPDSPAVRHAIARYTWRLHDHVLADGPQATCKVHLPPGRHTLALTITSAHDPNLTSFDTVTITVAPATPGPATSGSATRLNAGNAAGR